MDWELLAAFRFRAKLSCTWLRRTQRVIGVINFLRRRGDTVYRRRVALLGAAIQLPRVRALGQPLCLMKLRERTIELRLETLYLPSSRQLLVLHPLFDERDVFELLRLERRVLEKIGN